MVGNIQLHRELALGYPNYGSYFLHVGLIPTL